MGCSRVWLKQCEEGRMVWRERGGNVYKLAAGDGERRRNVKLKWPTCSVFFLDRALVPGGK